MIEKARVLGGHDGAFEMRRDALVRHPFVFQARFRIFRL
jgi:hypothetical protein